MDTATITPEVRAGVWARLAGLGQGIRDGETRDGYLAAFRAKFDRAFPAPPPAEADESILPDGRAVADITGRERRRCALIARDWLDREIDALGRWAGGEEGGSRRGAEAQRDAREAQGEPSNSGDVARGEAGSPAAGSLCASAPLRERSLIERFAYNLGRRVAGEVLSEEQARESLLQGQGGGDFIEPEYQTSYANGLKRPFDISGQVALMRCAGYPLTDLGNAERFRDLHGQDFVYTTAKGWMGWDGRRWRVLDQEADSTPAEVQAAVFSTVRALQDCARIVAATGWGSTEGLTEKDLIRMETAGEIFEDDGMNRMVLAAGKLTPLSAQLAKWGRTSEAAGKIGCIAGLAKRWLTRPIEDFDTEALAVNCLNGTLRFPRDGEGKPVPQLDAHARGDLITRLAPVDYDADAPAERYRAMIEWAQPDSRVRRYLRQWAGYNLTGLTGAQILHFWYGKGANGKSTVIDAWAGTLGDYAGTIGIETFLDQGIKKRGDAASPDLARLGGVRLLRASEPERGAKLNEALVKAATGGEPMAVRALHKGFFDLRPAFKLTIGGNYKPDIPGTDEGIWRRIKLVPWNSYLEEKDRDEALPDKLRPEYPGIFAWMVRGLCDWLEHGFIEPDAVKEATAEYRDDSDPLARFLRACTEHDPGGRVQSSVLHGVFEAWCKAVGEREWKPKGFSQALKAKGFTNKPSNGIQWLGIRLIRQASDFVDDQGRVLSLSGGDGGGTMTVIGEAVPGAGMGPAMGGNDDFDPFAA